MKKNVFIGMIVAIAAVCTVFAGSYGLAADLGEVAGTLKSDRITRDDSGKSYGTIDVSSESWLNVRTGPGTDNEIIGKLLRSQKVEILGETLGWYKISFEGREAYINGYYVAGVDVKNTVPDGVYGTVNVPGGEIVSLRVGAGMNNPVEGTLSAGARVRVLDKQDGWYKVQVDGHPRPLWIEGSYLNLLDKIEEPLPTGEVAAYVDVTDGSSLNLRTGPSTNDPIMREMSDGTKMKIIEICGDWYKVRLEDGATGYCYAKYVSKGEPGTQTTQPPVTGTIPGSSSGGQNVLETLQIPSNPEEVTPELAQKILAGLGYDRFSGYAEALEVFQSATIGSWNRGKTYTKGVLDSKTKEKLVQQANYFKEALAKYPQGTISKSDPRFNDWVKQASTRLANAPANLRDNNGNRLSAEAIVSGILVQESGKNHWKDKDIVISRCGAIGFMQIMPFHCPGAGNIYDPVANLSFGVKYINDQLGRSDFRVRGEDDSAMLAKALAAYNGGPGRSALTTMTWDEIVRSKSIPSESIHYAINIRKNIGVAITETERAYLANN